MLRLRFALRGFSCPGLALAGWACCALACITFGTTRAGAQTQTIVYSNGENNTSELTAGEATLSVSSGTATHSGPISGTGGITKAGAGTLILTGDNSGLSGRTHLGNGVLSLGSTHALGTSSIYFESGTLQFSAANTTDYSSRMRTQADFSYNIDTNGQDVTFASALPNSSIYTILVKLGAGTLTLAADNFLRGAVILSGTLQLGNGGTSGSATIDTESIDLASGATLAFNRSDNIGHSALITGAGSVTKLGSGTLTLNGSHVYSGGTTISDGFIEFSSLFNFGSGNITLDGGGLKWASAVDVSPRLVSVLGDGGGSFDTNGQNVTLSTAFSGGGSVIKLGVGTLTLTADQTYTGGTTISAGTLQLGNGEATGWISHDITNNATLAFNRSADVTFAHEISGNGGVTQLGAGTLTLTGSNTFTGTLAIAAGTVQLGDSGTVLADNGDVSLTGGTLRLGTGTETIGTLSGTDGTLEFAEGSAATLTINQASDTTFSGTIAGTSGTLLKSGSGALTLTGENTFAGTLTLSAGTLLLGNGGASGSVAGDIANHGALAFNRSNDTVYAGAISGSGSLTKSGNGTLTLSGNNTYAGATTIDGGLIAFDTANRLGTGAITLDGGGLRWLGHNADLSARFNSIGAAGAIFDTNGNDVTFASALSSSGTLTKTGAGALTLQDDLLIAGGVTLTAGTLALQGNNSISGSISVSGSTLEFSSSANLGAGTVTADGATLRWATGGTSDISAQLAPLGASGVTFDTNGNDITLASAVTGTGALTKTGAGTLTLGAASTRGSDTTISAGAIRLGHALALQNSVVTSSVHDGLDLNGLSATLAGLAGAGNLALGSGTLTLGGNDASTTYTGVLSGTGALAKNGAGTLTLSGSAPSSFAGGTTINAGAVQLPALDRLGSGSVTLAAGTLRWTDGAAADSAVNAIVLGTGGGTFDTNGNDVTLSGGVSGNALTKTGAGTLTLIDTSTHSGTTIAAGTLQVGNGGSSGTLGTGDVSIATGATLEYNRSDSIAYSGVISGGGAFTKAGAGTLTLSGTSTSFSGSTNITAGELAIGGSLATNSLSVTNGSLSGSGSVQLGTGGISVSGNATLSTPLQLPATSHTWTIADGADATFSGTITGGSTTGGVQRLTVTSVGSSNALLTFNGQHTFRYNELVFQQPFEIALGNSATLVVDPDTGELWSVTSGPLGANPTRIAAPVWMRSTDATPRALGQVNFGTSSVIRLGDTNPAQSGALSLFGQIQEQVGDKAEVNLQVDSPVTIHDIFPVGFMSGGSRVLTKTGASTLTLEGIVNLARVVVNAGTLATSNASGTALGNSLLVLTLDGGAFRPLADFSLTRTTQLGSNGGTFDTPADITLNWNGAISGGGALTKIGDGTLVLGGTNSYSGDTTVNAGTLKIAAASAFSPNTRLHVAPGAHFDANGHQPTFGELSGTGTINTGTAGIVLSAAAHHTFSGVLAGSGGFTKSGSGTLTLPGTHTFSGPTQVTAGRIHLTGSAANSPFTVSGGGVLSGTGTLGALTIDSGGVVSPGASPGTLSATDTTFAGGGSLLWEINNATGIAGANPGWDLLSISGSLNIAATSANTFTINLTSLTPADVAGNAANFNPASNYTFNFVTASSGITGFDTSDFTLDTSAFTNPLSGAWSIASDGTSLSLNYTASAIPEPSTYAAIAGAAMLALAVLRRKRRA